MSVKKNHMRIFCPHCGGEINVAFEASALSPRRYGPAPYDPGPSVDAFVIDAIENRKLSLRTIGDLLREQGVPTAKGGMWSASGVQKLYTNALERRVANNSRQNPAV